MSWVLWDIFIPLLTTFALGLLLGWMLWRWRRQLMGTDELIISGPGQENFVASAEMESANIALIGERDTVVQQLEEANNDIAQLRASNAEFEKNQNNAPDQASIDASDNATANALKTDNAGIGGAEAKESEELKQMQQNLDTLAESLDREKESRRQLELDLLNAKNRCEKLELQLDTEPGAVVEAAVPESPAEVQETQGISLELHHHEISERDTQIEDLKRQLQFQIDAAVSDEAGESGNAALVPTQDKTVTSSDDKKTTGIKQSEVNGKKAKRTVKKSSTKKTASSYVPTDWVIPAQVPTKSERDKLTEIKGVGPVLQGLLHDSGIYYYRQVALLDKSGVDELQEQIPQFPGRIRRDKWVSQAKQLHRKKYGSAP